MNTEVIKNIKVMFRVYEPTEINDAEEKEFVFICRNCGKEILSREEQTDKYDEIEFNLSLHLMSCEFYSTKLENAST